MAWDVNQVIVVGRLTRDPDEMSYTGNGVPLCKFSLANGRGQGDQEEVNYFDIVTWNKVATNCNNYLKKGSQVVVEGRLKQERFQDKTGQNRSKVVIVASNVQFLTPKSSSGEPAPSRQAHQPANQQPQRQPQRQVGSSPQNIEFESPEPPLEDDGVPF